jgi:three-Cys-motif partner protein
VTSLFPGLPRSPRPARIKSPTHPVWTENKAKLIERYLFYFVQVTKHGTYIDAFSGPQEPEKHDMWSAKLVLESKPQWFRHFYLFEQDPAKVEMLEKLKAEQPALKPKREIRVFPGDCNVTIPSFLAEGAIKEKEATFCLLDQRTFECDWSTVEALAKHKAGNKIELFYFLASKWFDRSLSAVKDKGARRVRAWWGKDDWKNLRDMSGRERADAFVERFKSDLRYKYAMPWPIYSRHHGGSIMYFMIHATDHDAAPQLMARAYERTTQPRETQEQLEWDLAKLAENVSPESE